MGKEKSFLVRVKSSDSTMNYPGNTAGSFIVDLPIRLYLLGEWRCGLIEIECPTPSSYEGHIYVVTDFINDSVTGNFMRPILREMYSAGHHEFRNVEYIKVTQETMTQMSVRLCNEQMVEIAFPENSVTHLTLNFTLRK